MKIIILLFVSLCLCSQLYINTARADDIDSSAILSPNCSAEQIKDIAGDALISISKNQSWDDEVKGYIIKLDTSKMSYDELAKKMNEKSCFNKP